MLAICFGGAASLMGQIGGAGGYGGPAILSRGQGQAGTRGAEAVQLNFHASVNGTYDSGVTPVGTTQDGKIVNAGGLWGIDAEVGAYGTHQWKKSSIGLEYSGDYRHYNSNTYYNGADHIISMDFVKILTKRTLLSLRQTGGTTARAYGGVLGVGFTNFQDSTQPGVPSNQIFDSRAYFIDSTARITYIMNARTSFSFYGGGFAVRYHSRQLVGQDSYRFGADWARRLSRRKTISVGYGFQRYDYPRAFGGADIHTVTVGYSQAIGKSWQISGSAGINILNIVGTRLAQLDPIVAQLFGRTTGVEAFDTTNFLSNLQGVVARRFRRSSLSLAYQRGVLPGNGVLLTSKNETASVSYSYSTSRKIGFFANFSYSSIGGLSAVSGQYSFIGGGGGASYVLSKHIQFRTNVDVRRAQTTQDIFQRSGVRVSAGFTFTPSSIPLLWH
jgi:hypothetical protein